MPFGFFSCLMLIYWGSYCNILEWAGIWAYYMQQLSNRKRRRREYTTVNIGIYVLASLGVYQYNTLLLLLGIAEEKARKQGTYIFSFVFYFVYTFCMLLLFNRIFYAFSNIIFISTNYSILYCTFHSVFLVQWMHHIKEKMLGEYGKYVYYLLCSFLYYIVPTTHHNSSTVSSSFHCCWRVGMMAYFLFTYYCKWGGHTYHFFMAHFFTLLLSGFEC